MIERKAALAVPGSALALARVLLIFIGFILPKAAIYSERTADKFRWISRLGLIPFPAALFCA
jgi:hypothetical protein